MSQSRNLGFHLQLKTMAVSVDPNELRLPLKKAHASEEQGYVVYHDP
jgi:hypothetical protein